MSSVSWQIESNMIFFDGRSWVTFRRLGFSESHLEVLIPESWRIRHHVDLVQATVCHLQPDVQTLEPSGIAFNSKVLFRDSRLDWHPKWFMVSKNSVLSQTACHLELLVQESWSSCHLNCISRALWCPWLSGCDWGHVIVIFSFYSDIPIKRLVIWCQKRCRTSSMCESDPFLTTCALSRAQADGFRKPTTSRTQ